MTIAAGLVAELQARLGEDVGVAAREISGPMPLWPEERRALDRATPDRLAEFSTGRACARAAMVNLGAPEAAVPVGRDRAPIWPEGIAGSISHGSGLCVALIAHAAKYPMLGVDLEPDAPLPPDVVAEVLFTAEHRVPVSDQRILFSAKEAVYKAFYPIARQVWGFDAVQVRLDGAAFEARITVPVHGWTNDTPVHGHVLRRDGVIVTALSLSPLK